MSQGKDCKCCERAGSSLHKHTAEVLHEKQRRTSQEEYFEQDQLISTPESIFHVILLYKYNTDSGSTYKRLETSQCHRQLAFRLHVQQAAPAALAVLWVMEWQHQPRSQQLWVSLPNLLPPLLDPHWDISVKRLMLSCFFFFSFP